MATQWTAGLVDGTPLPASTLNTIGAAWESYTPTVKQGATTLSGTFAYAKYARINKTVWVQISFSSTSTGSASGVIAVTYPSGLAPANNAGYRPMGTVVLLDAGVAFYQGSAVVYSATEFAGMADFVGGFMGNSGPAITIASGDGFWAQLCYEVA